MPQTPPTCPSPNTWCSYQATDNITIIILIAYLCVLVTLTLLTTIQYIRLIRLKHSNRDRFEDIFGNRYLYIYWIVFGWLICGIGKSCVNLGVYYRWMVWEQQPDPDQGGVVVDIGGAVVVLAKVFMFLDFMCAYFVLLLIVLIPYQWIRQLLSTLCQFQSIPIAHRLKINLYYKLLKATKYYILAHSIIFLSLLIIQPFIFFLTTSPVSCYDELFNIFWIFGHEIVVIAVYLFGLWVGLYLRANGLVRLRDGDLRRIGSQYFVLMLVMVMRVANFVFKLFASFQYKPNHVCADFRQGDKLIASVYLVLGSVFMHIVPIVVVLLIYRPVQQIAIRTDRIVTFKHDRYVGPYTSFGEQSEITSPNTSFNK